MNKPLHPSGTHRLKLLMVNKSTFGDLMAQCIFQGTGSNIGCYTISRLISKYGRWADSSHPFLEQLSGFNHDNDLVSEIRNYIGQEFLCKIPKQGSKNQMNISQFLEMESNINSKSHVVYEPLSGESQVHDV